MCQHDIYQFLTKIMPTPILASFYFMLSLMAVFGALEISSSLILQRNTNGLYIGAIYAGIVGLICAFFGFIGTIEWSKQRGVFGGFVFLNLVTVITSIVGAAMTSQQAFYLESLASCAYYSPGNTCDGLYGTDTTCIGNSNTFYYAELCTVQFVDIPVPDTCYCTFKGANDLYQCAIFEQINNCHTLMHADANRLRRSSGFAIALLIISTFLLCVRNYRYLRYQGENGNEMTGVIVVDAHRNSNAEMAVEDHINNTSPPVYLVTSSLELQNMKKAVATYANNPIASSSSSSVPQINDVVIISDDIETNNNNQHNNHDNNNDNRTSTLRLSS
jgi:hypothetical protein